MSPAITEILRFGFRVHYLISVRLGNAGWSALGVCERGYISRGMVNMKGTVNEYLKCNVLIRYTDTNYAPIPIMDRWLNLKAIADILCKELHEVTLGCSLYMQQPAEANLYRKSYM